MEIAAAQPSVGSQLGNLSPDLFKKFSDLIYNIAGIRFQESKNYFLSSKLKNRCEALGHATFDAYYNFLNSPSAKSAEYHHLMDEITINETFFFRNQPQLDVLERKILPELLKKRRDAGRKRIRIWSCASSTGDEAYTTILQLLEMPEARDFQFEVVGTDICRDAIGKAEAGIYKQYAVRNIPPAMMQKYFSKDEVNNSFILSDPVKKFARFVECNLIDDARIRMLGKFDIALCRNVLIYFDEASKERALKNISNALEDDGLLVAGHSENLYSHRHIFKQVKELDQAHAYQKAPPGTEKSRV